MEKILANDLFRPIYPTPAALVVSADENKKSNIMTAGEVFNIGLRNPVIIGIAIRKATYTHTLISKTMEFTVNMPTASMLEKVDSIGTISGRDGLDKFAAYDLTPVPSTKVVPPIIKECPLNMECRGISITEVGDHDLFLGEVVAMYVDADKIDEQRRVIMEKMDGFTFSNQKYYRIGDWIEDIGFSRRGGKG